MTFEEWWNKQTENFDPSELGLMQLARVTWNAAQDAEREACAIAIEEIGSGHPPHGHHYARCAAAIRARSNKVE